MSAALSDEDLGDLYRWVDTLSLSRPKRNIARDFSDAVLCAEIVHSSFPKYVELHNYAAAHAVSKKEYNWNTLNRKVFKKINFSPNPSLLKEVAQSRPGAIERLLFLLKNQITAFQTQHKRRSRHRGDDARRAHHHNTSVRGPVSMSSARGPSSVASDYFEVAGRGPVSPASFPARRHKHRSHPQVDEELLVEKEAQIQELKDTVEILELKIQKLEQLVRLKDSKIESLQARRYR